MQHHRCNTTLPPGIILNCFFSPMNVNSTHWQMSKQFDFEKILNSISTDLQFILGNHIKLII